MSELLTAIVPPRPARPPIERKAVTELVGAVDQSRITTLCAPAGYGKTTVALQWSRALAARGRPILWIAARAGIVSVADFTIALKAAAAAAGLDWSSLPAEVSGADLAAATVRLKPGPVLILDDAQLLAAAVLDVVADTVARARDALTTIVVSRSRSTLPLARLRSLGYLVEVGVDRLRFSLAEAAELVGQAGRGPLDAQHLQQLVEDTRGWPAGIVLAAATPRAEWTFRSAPSARPSQLRRNFEAFFEEEVLSLQPQPIRDFLVETAVLDELTPAACAAVRRSENSRLLLESCEEAGLFIEVADNDLSCYRHHPLLRESILRRLYDREPARAAELHRRASRHFAEAGDSCAALRHAELSGDRTFLADQLDALAEPLVYAGYLYRIEALASGLPGTLLATRPNLALALAWRQIRSLAFNSAEALIALAENHVKQSRDSDGFSACRAQHLGRMIEHRRIMLDAARDDMPKVEQRAEALLAEFGDDQPYLSCTLLAQLMSARRELYHFHDMLRLEAETRRALNRPGSDFASIALKSSVSPTLMVQGKMETARRMLEEAFTLARSIQGPGSGLAALPALPLAELQYDQGNLAEARQLVDVYLPLARQWGFVDQIAAGHIVRARLLAAQGDIDGALKALDDTHLVAIECGLDRLRAFAVGEQVRILVRNGQPQQAHAAFHAGGHEPSGEPYPTMHPTRQHESIAISWVRLEMQDYRLVRARKVAKRWSEFVRHNGAIRSAVAFSLLLAEIAVLSGDRSEAKRAVREAVTLAAPAGWVRIFLDEGDAIGSLLVETYADGPRLDSVPDQFAQRLVAAFSGSPELEPEEDYGLGSKLVNRELDILRMVGGGLRNREIGDRLGLTEGTVKWYMQQIYDKLGVRRRPQAVMRARQLGVLA